MTDYYLQHCGIVKWRLRQSEALSEVNEWDLLQDQVASCTACKLHQTRTHTVFGTGNPFADLMFIGEAPGAEEDRQGKPFVGRAGQLLTQMIRAIGLNRDDVFIANILKCRPPNNRDPLPEEVIECTPFLERQILKIQPKLLIALGRIAAHSLLKTTIPLTRLRGQTFHFGADKTPLFVTFHPAYLLRTPAEKAKAYEDLLRIKNYMRNSS